MDQNLHWDQSKDCYHSLHWYSQFLMKANCNHQQIEKTCNLYLKGMDVRKFFYCPLIKLFHLRYLFIRQ